ncbi:MAG: alanine--tRNA ligase, partial [Candidatus Sungbacteria bacterium]|nr:alanine--tRNA ligase [Candidatus Sungbacteria bacterium]
MKSEELREKFLDFFERNGHTVVPSSSLIPDDPSVLLTTAGMQQFKPYYTGEADPMATIHPTLGKPLGSHNAVSIQKSFRTSDIDEVGDERHLTFFEMMGNFSFGGYFKEEAIKYAFDFLTKEVGLEISYVTIFEGKDGIGVPKDEASRKIWQSLGIADIREEGIEDVFWGPTGSSGPCGPTTEIYCKNGAGEDIEVWNIVFNECFFAGSREELLLGASGKKLERLKTPGVDTGMGLERLAMCAQKTPTIFETDLFKNLIQLLPVGVHIKHKRVIADHLRASVFLLADDVRPSNKDRGYILRRLIRRCFVYEYMEEIPIQVFETILIETVDQYNFYRVLKERQEVIREEFRNERMRFRKLLPHGLIEINHRIARDKELEKKSSHPIIVKPLSGFQAGLFAFGLFSDSGVPVEVSKELFAEADYDLSRFEEGVQ